MNRWMAMALALFLLSPQPLTPSGEGTVAEPVPVACGVWASSAGGGIEAWATLPGFGAEPTQIALTVSGEGGARTFVAGGQGGHCRMDASIPVRPGATYLLTFTFYAGDSVEQRQLTVEV